MGTGRDIFLIVTFLASFKFALGEEEGCRWLVTRESYTCSDGEEKSYEDMRPDGKIDTFCCKPGTKDYDARKSTRENCRVTDCEPDSEMNLCTKLPVRNIGDKQLIFEEVLTEKCAKGSFSLCCPSTAKEFQLWAAHGAEPHQFPHQVRLAPSPCGGTIYNEQYIITAAHCVVFDGAVTPASNVTVSVGSNMDRIEEMGTEFVYQVEEIIVHKNYSRLRGKPEFDKFGKKSQLYFDVALLKLNRKLVLNDPAMKVKALELAPKDFKPLAYADKAAGIGWGTTDLEKQSPYLQKFVFPIRSDEMCYGKKGVVPQYKDYMDQMLCVTGVFDDGKFYGSVGEGDSGGGLICRGESGHPVLCGIASFMSSNDPTCGHQPEKKKCLPNTYAEASFFRDWIEEKTGTKKTHQAIGTLYRPYLYGKNVNAANYLHQVHVTSTSGKKCGGTLIAGDVVVTAAQCVTQPGKKADPKKIKVGYHTNKLSEEPLEIYDVDSVSVMQGFGTEATPGASSRGPNGIDLLKDVFYHNDLAVLRLANSVPATSFPMLPDANESFQDGVELALPFESDSKYYENLRARDFRIVPKKICQKRFDKLDSSSQKDIDENVLCAAEVYSGGSSCDRELGGGLICKRPNGDEVLCGVQAFRMCISAIPNIFMDLGIKKNLQFVQNNK